MKYYILLIITLLSACLGPSKNGDDQTGEKYFEESELDNTRPWIGASMKTLASDPSSNGNDTGVILISVHKNFPAYNAGLKRGDKIISFKGNPVSNVVDLEQDISRCEVGDTSEVTIRRGSDEKSVSLILMGEPKEWDILKRPLLNQLAPQLEGVYLNPKQNGQDNLVRLIMFFSSWCGYCQADMPHVVKLYNNYKDSMFSVVAISKQDSTEINSYIEEKNLPFSVLMDVDHYTNANYKVTGTPSYFVLNKKGEITNYYTGFDQLDQIEEAIKKLL